MLPSILSQNRYRSFLPPLPPHHVVTHVGGLLHSQKSWWFLPGAKALHTPVNRPVNCCELNVTTWRRRNGPSAPRILVSRAGLGTLSVVVVKSPKTLEVGFGPWRWSSKTSVPNLLPIWSQFLYLGSYPGAYLCSDWCKYLHQRGLGLSNFVVTSWSGGVTSWERAHYASTTRRSFRWLSTIYYAESHVHSWSPRFTAS
jgi:hypothetical protein